MRPIPILLIPALALAACGRTWSDPHGAPSFPLLDAHALPCAACHTVPGTYTGLDPACASCHESDRPADHFSGVDCGGCHRPTTWSDAHVDHSFFPLTDAHDLDCPACHHPGTWTDLSPACASCHEADRPAGHFTGEDCGDCHRPTTWSDATFDHTPYFPIPHSGIDTCSDCHLDAPDYTSFSCIDCHTHAKSVTDSHHTDVSGYSYESAACLRCHPNGVAEDGR